jgi:hypothetical protein
VKSTHRDQIPAPVACRELVPKVRAWTEPVNERVSSAAVDTRTYVGNRLFMGERPEHVRECQKSRGKKKKIAKVVGRPKAIFTADDRETAAGRNEGANEWKLPVYLGPPIRGLRRCPTSIVFVHRRRFTACICSVMSVGRI